MTKAKVDRKVRSGDFIRVAGAEEIVYLVVRTDTGKWYRRATFYDRFDLESTTEEYLTDNVTEILFNVNDINNAIEVLDL